MEEKIEVGSIVTGLYKTGKYVGEVTEIRPSHYLVRVLAVLKHPTQGDLHNPNQTDVALFHEGVPDYKESLAKALSAQIEKYEGDESSFAQQCLVHLKNLEKDYFPQT
jgi:kinase-associated protein B